MRYGVGVALALFFGVLAAGQVSAAQPCEVMPMPCTFEGPGFAFTIVDGDTKKPLSDVHALVEWQMYGAGFRLNGPVMVLDAISGADGGVAFPAWGPVDGSVLGLGVGRDPVVSLFKSGYEALIIENTATSPGDEHARIRRAGQDRQTYALQPFRGTPSQWLQQLRLVWLGRALARSEEATLKFRAPYLRRMRLISAERVKLPPSDESYEGFFWQVDRQLKLLEGVPR